MDECMKAFQQGVEADYALAVEDLRAVIEKGAVHRKNKEGLEYLETRSVDCAERWLEDSGDLKEG